jgi:hypothetical protein
VVTSALPENAGLRDGGIGIGAVRHQLAFTGQVRITFTQLVQAAGDNDRSQPPITIGSTRPSATPWSICSRVA